MNQIAFFCWNMSQFYLKLFIYISQFCLKNIWFFRAKAAQHVYQVSIYSNVPSLHVAPTSLVSMSLMSLVSTWRTLHWSLYTLMSLVSTWWFASHVPRLHPTDRLPCSPSQILPGNMNTYSPERRELVPPIMASKVRFVPHSDHQRTVCMRVELHGCPYTGEWPVMTSPYTGEKPVMTCPYTGERPVMTCPYTGESPVMSCPYTCEGRVITCP